MQRRSLLKATAGLAAASLAGPAIGQDLRARTLRLVPQANLTSLDPIWTTATRHREPRLDGLRHALFGLTDDLQAQPQMAEGHQVSRRRPHLDASGCATGCGSMTASRCARGTAPPAWRAGRERDTFGQSLGAVVDAWEAAGRPHAADPAEVRPSRCCWRRWPSRRRVAFIMPERLAQDRPVPAGDGDGRLRPLPLPGRRVRLRQPRGLCAEFDALRAARRSRRAAPPAASSAHFERIEWTIIPDSATAAAALQSGEIDWWEQAERRPDPGAAPRRAITVEVADTLGYLGDLPLQPPASALQQPGASAARCCTRSTRRTIMRAVTGNDPDAWRVCHSMWPCGTPYGTRRRRRPLAGPRDLDRVRGICRGRLQGREGRHHQPRPTSRPSARFGQVTADLLRGSA